MSVLQTGRSWLNSAFEEAAARRRVTTRAPWAEPDAATVAAAAEAEAAQAAAATAAQAGGIGGGPAIATPQGQSWPDELRRAVLGG
jgi:hypothetical protein